jgi:hypothetical protein
MLVVRISPQLPCGIGIGIIGQVIGVLGQDIQRGNSTRPIGIWETLDICVVPAVALSQGVRTSTPATWNSGLRGELGTGGWVPESRPWRLGLLPDLMGCKVDHCIPSQRIGGDLCRVP